MKKQILGSSSLEITKIGFGAWAIGGPGYAFGWGKQDDNDSIKAILKALDLGVNWIDTAAVYGTGRSEEIVFEALKQWHGEKPYIFTKCSLVWDENRNISNSYKPESIRNECENSLRRLKVDAIDLYQMHWPPPDDNSLIDAAWETMARLREEGKVKWIGVSNFNLKQIEQAEKIAPVTSLQPPYSMLHRDVEKEILPYCRKQNIGALAYSPMASGMLTGSMTLKRVNNFPDNDWRKGSPDFTEPELSRNLHIVEKLKAIGKKYDRNPGETAIAWVLTNPAVTGAIAGARNEKQVEGVYHASEFELSIEDIKEIDEMTK
ncbi:MAG: aldo/keto reductase [Ignavibacteriaceae bacterium]